MRRSHQRDEDPHLAAPELVVLEQLGPGVADDEPAEAEVDPDRHRPHAPPTSTAIRRVGMGRKVAFMLTEMYCFGGRGTNRDA